MEETQVDDKNAKERNMQKFYDNYSQFKKKTDQDIDGKIYADQLDNILKMINPEIILKDEKKSLNQQNQAQVMRKLTDDEKIMDIIHGTYKEPIFLPKPRKRHIHKAPISPHHFSALPPFHEFPPPSSAHPNHSRTWGKTVISIRNADGSSETRKVEKTPDGNTRTTITKMDSDGNSSTKSFIGDEKSNSFSQSSTSQMITTSSNHDERNLVNHNGYKIPCLW